MNSPTRLGSKLAGAVASPAAAPASSKPTKLGGKRAAIAGRRRARRVLPELGEVEIELPGALLWSELEAAAHKRAAELTGDSPDPTRFAFALEAQLALRVLAAAVRDPDDPAAAFGTLEEWGALDNDVVNAAWMAFGDVREELDPVSQPLTDDQMVAIASAVKKKDAATLRTFGIAMLSRWLCSTDALQSTSPQPSSANTESPSASSES